MSTDAVQPYIDFYGDQAKSIRDLDNARRAVLVIISAVVVGLLVVLDSAPLVWGYIGLLYLATVWAFSRLGRALRVTIESGEHLEAVARQARHEPTKSEFVEFIGSLVTPDDMSNVPEAIAAMAHGRVTGEGVRVTANSSFAVPASEVSFANFLRTSLVLGGLFGTVLFFALELGSETLLAGDLGDLLPGLKGALASTLTGILGSLGIGLVASNANRRLDRFIWETEAFLTTAVEPILTAASTRQPIKSEADLWEGLRQEVALMAERAEESYERMAEDAHTYAVALQTISDRFDSLPQVRLSEGVASLERAVSDFKHASDVIGNTVPPLIEAVGSLGLFAPSKMLSDMEELSQQVKQARSESSGALAKMTAKVDEATTEVKGVRDDVRPAVQRLTNVAANVNATAERLDGTADRVHTSAESISGSAEEVGGAIASVTSGLGAVERTVQEGLGSVGSALGELGSSVNQKLDDVRGGVKDDLEGVERAIKEAADDTGERLSAIEEGQSGVASEVQELKSDLSDLPGQEGLLARVDKRISRLERVYEWYDRAERAPLMRFLLAPLWSRRTSGGRHAAD